MPPPDVTRPLPSDAELTAHGLAPQEHGTPGQSRVLLIACGALAHEVMALIRLNHWQHMDLQCLPAILHNHPEKITPAVGECIDRNRGKYARIFVLYADCGTGGGLERLCAEKGVEMLQGPHCYSFFTGNDAFAATAGEDLTTFYLTDFLTRGFDAFVWKPLGLDRHPELLEMYFGHYEKLVYLAQTDQPELDKRAAEAAARLGLRYERRFTGYGDLENELNALA